MMDKCKFCSLDIDDDVLCDICAGLIDDYLKTKKHFLKIKEKFQSFDKIYKTLGYSFSL